MQRPKSSVREGRSDASSSNEENGFIELYEEYEWAGQKRIRVSSLLEGGYAALGLGDNPSGGGRNGHGCSGSSQAPGNQLNEDEEEEDLNVDEDDTQIYGPTQYAESDVIPPHPRRRGDSYLNVDNDDDDDDVEDEEEEEVATSGNELSVEEVGEDVTSYMRRLITGVEPCASPQRSSHGLSPSTSEITTIDVITSSVSTEDVMVGSSSEKGGGSHHGQIIASLKAKLHYYERQTAGRYKCLICLDDYRNPAISVACWHVHCEKCWLRSLGTRKLCPQCNLITTPKDLRRIYM